jgi:hypothetical protein
VTLLTIPLPYRRLAALLALAGAFWLKRATGSEPEDELKATAVLSFLRYSEWPASTGGAVTVGVLGRPGFKQVLSRTIEGKSVNNRPIRVIEIKGAAGVRCCQLIYFATDKAEEIKQGLSNAHALTIGEADRFLDYGGAIHLFIDDGHLSFEASLDAIERSGTSVGSNLLRRGQIVERGKGRGPK